MKETIGKKIPKTSGLHHPLKETVTPPIPPLRGAASGSFDGEGR